MAGGHSGGRDRRTSILAGRHVANGSVNGWTGVAGLRVGKTACKQASEITTVYWLATRDPRVVVVCTIERKSIRWILDPCSRSGIFYPGLTADRLNQARIELSDIISVIESPVNKNT